MIWHMYVCMYTYVCIYACKYMYILTYINLLNLQYIYTHTNILYNILQGGKSRLGGQNKYNTKKPCTAH